MNNQEYILTQTVLINTAKILQPLKLNEFIERALTAESAGPIFDPSLYRAGIKRLELIRELASRAIAFRGALDNLHAEMAAECDRLGCAPNHLAESLAIVTEDSK